MSLRDLVEGEALDDDENDGDVAENSDGEIQERTGRANHYDDSSEEDEDEDDDEDAARAVSVNLNAKETCALTCNSNIGPRGVYR
jgi:transcription elongation factor SPT6